MGEVTIGRSTFLGTWFVEREAKEVDDCGGLKSESRNLDFFDKRGSRRFGADLKYDGVWVFGRFFQSGNRMPHSKTWRRIERALYALWF
jgi:hypothetical protein